MQNHSTQGFRIGEEVTNAPLPAEVLVARDDDDSDHHTTSISPELPDEKGEDVECFITRSNPLKRRKISNNASTKCRNGIEESLVNLTNIVTLFLENSQKQLDVFSQTLAIQGATAKASSGTYGGSSGSNRPSSKSEEEHQLLLKCMKALNAVDDIGALLYVTACRLLLADKAWRMMFLMVPDNMKKDVIRNY